MALVKCKECGKEVSAKASSCVHCGAALKSAADVKSTNDIEKNIDFFILWANAVRIITIIAACIVAVGSLLAASNAEDMSFFVVGLIAAGLILLSTKILENKIRWKAYMLKSIHELNMKN